MSKLRTGKTNNSKYMSLAVYRGRQFVLILTMIVGTGLFGFLFYADAFNGPQATWALSVCGVLAIVMMLLPKTEEWKYLPWQDAGQKCETDFFD